MFMQLAFKNITRNKKRTILTLSAVFFGVFLIIVAQGFNNGLGARTANLYINADTGAAKVVSKNYQLENLDNPLEYPIANYQPLLAELAADQRIKAFSPRITFRGSLGRDNDEIVLTGIGVDPVQEDKVFARSAAMTAGSFFKSGQKGIVIGKKLSEILNLRVGDSVTVIARATQMGYNATDLVIVGLINTNNPAIDENTFFVPLGFAKDFLSCPWITDIAVSLKRLGLFDQVKQDFDKQKHGGASVDLRSWKYFARDYLSIIKIQNMKIAVLSLTILLMAAAGIANTMLMAMMERKREIANFMAMGMPKGKIMVLFLLEGLVIGFIGSLAGLVLGAFMVWILGKSGMTFAGATPVFNLMSGIIYLIFGTMLATISTIFPAQKATKLLPVEVFRDNQG